MSDINDTKKTSLDLLPAVAMLACAVWFFFLISILILVHCTSALTIDKVGALGDSFGILNALVTTLTLIGLLYSIRQQQEEIQQNRIEALEQRKESEAKERLDRLVARLNALPILIEQQRKHCQNCYEAYASQGPRETIHILDQLFRSIPEIEELNAFVNSTDETQKYHDSIFAEWEKLGRKGPRPIPVNPSMMRTRNAANKLRSLLLELEEVYSQIRHQSEPGDSRRI